MGQTSEQLGCGPFSPGEQLPKALRDVLTKARTCWLRNQDVVDLLTNYRAYHFKVSKEAPQKPPGGSLFLFNRKTVRFFRKDGHDWRKKSDGKTIRETHEKLKVGNKDVLNCYYAHAEDSLQRRCYWLLDGDDNVVLVHYLSSIPHANRAMVHSASSGHGLGAVCLNAVQAQPAQPQQAQTSISSAWQPPAAGVTAADDGMARTASMPDSFGSSVRCQQPCSGAGQGLPTVFTVTTGDIAMPSSHADESSPEPDEAAVQQQQTGDYDGKPLQVQQPLATPFAASAAHSVYGNGAQSSHANGAVAADATAVSAAAQPAVRHHEGMVSEFARADSVPQSAAAPPPARSGSGQVAAAGACFEDGMRLGPLHSAPSFSGGTVQTGSTVDPAELRRARSTGAHAASSSVQAEPAHTQQQGTLSRMSSSEHHTLAPPPRLEFVGQPAGAKAHALRPVCALEVQDISLTLPPSDSAGRLSRDTSTTLAGGLQRSHPGLKLGLGPGPAPRTEGSPAQPVVPGISWV